MSSTDDDPLAAFCAELRKRWKASGRDLSSVAREVRMSRSQLYAVLNGGIRRPPDFDTVVRPLMQACRATDAEVADWRRRHEILVAVHTELRRPRAESAAAPAPVQAPAQLPTDVEGFSGRTAALATLHSADARVVTITGPGGVGKTALAVHWAYQVAGDFPDGQLYVDLRGFSGGYDIVEPADAIRSFLDALGVEPHHLPPGLDAQAALYRSRTAERRMLVVLDNARDAEQIRPLLAGGPGVRTIVTSRDRLPELVTEVGALPLPLDPPGHAEALELLRRRTGVQRWDDNDAATIVTACGRLPLALALVATRVRQTGFPLVTLAAELRRSDLDVLDGVWTAFSWSYRALSTPAARLFRLLGITGGADISATAAAALAGVPYAEVRGALRELTEASLLTERVPGRYQLHDLLRHYGGELARRTDADDDRQAALTRLLDHYTHTAYEADLVLNPTRAPIPMRLEATGEERPTAGFDMKAARQWMDAERAVVMSALRQAKDAGLDRQVWQLGWALDTFLHEQNRWQDEGAAWAVALQAATSMVDRPAAAFAHRFLGVVAGRLARFEDAYAHLRDAAKLCSAADDRPGEAETHYVMSYVCWLQQDYDRALDHARRALTMWSELGDAAWQGKASNAVGWYLAELGDPQQALWYHEQALALHQETGNLAHESSSLHILARAHHFLGQYEEAISLYDEGLRQARALADEVIEAQIETHLGDTHQALGDQTRARERWQHAYLLLTDIGHPQAADVLRRLQIPGAPTA